MDEFIWTYQSFNELSSIEVFEILKIRCEVFVVEQQCAYLDPDEKDFHAIHLTCRNKGEIAAYARIIPPGISYFEPSIGRVLTSGKYRRTGLGKILMEKAIAHCTQAFPMHSIRISAQLYLLDFYNQLGFQVVDEPYLEDNIPHCAMILENKATHTQ